MNKSNPQKYEVEQMPPETALARLFDVLIEMDYDLERCKKKEKDDASYRGELNPNPA